jgi:hypothetical protein
MNEAPPSAWRFYKVGLLVTGKGEAKFLPKLLRTLSASSACHFQVLRKIDQRLPITSRERQLKMAGTGKAIPTKDEEEIGFRARKWLGDDPAKLLVLIDDLEHDRRGQRGPIFDRYRGALDAILLSGEQRTRASVHFLVNMLEAYYFAHVDAANAVLGTSLSDHAGDVEEIRHPKGELRRHRPGFDEVVHGELIVGRLDLDRVLGNPETCASLRTLFAWCALATGGTPDARFCLDSGAYDITTGPQLGRLAPP